MNETTGAVLIVGGVVALIMSVKGSWRKVWAALVPENKSAQASARTQMASFNFDPGGVVTQGGGTTDGSGRPGTSPAPLPGGGSYDALVRGNLRFAGVDQGIDFTGPGQILAPIAGLIRRVQRSGSGWSGDGAFELLDLENGRHMYVAEDFQPTVRVGQRVRAGDVIGIATGSGHAPGIEVGWADAQGHALAPLYPNPHSPKPAGNDFNAWVQALTHSGAGVTV